VFGAKVKKSIEVLKYWSINVLGLQKIKSPSDFSDGDFIFPEAGSNQDIPLLLF
jgi:hypothetical protein